MSSADDQITLKPIGVVKNGVTATPHCPDWQLDTVSELVIDPKWAEGLEGLEGFSHIIVLFWIDRITEKEVPLKVHPMHREDLPVTGLFSTRTPNRPNRIGLTVVRLLERRGNVLRVTGLDALDGTPVLDIKPYLRSGELIPEATEPPWTLQNHA
jgi:tRNA-Thr(GGU) m(6)t(6)A37 methyltransferase TsaA